MDKVIWEDPDELGYRLVPAKPTIPQQVSVDEDGKIVLDSGHELQA
jgi:hypothetical protein